MSERVTNYIAIGLDYPTLTDWPHITITPPFSTDSNILPLSEIPNTPLSLELGQIVLIGADNNQPARRVVGPGEEELKTVKLSIEQQLGSLAGYQPIGRIYPNYNPHCSILLEPGDRATCGLWLIRRSQSSKIFHRLN
jgi:hypothetical protein